MSMECPINPAPLTIPTPLLSLESSEHGPRVATRKAESALRWVGCGWFLGSPGPWLPSATRSPSTRGRFSLVVSDRTPDDTKGLTGLRGRKQGLAETPRLNSSGVVAATGYRP